MSKADSNRKQARKSVAPGRPGRERPARQSSAWKTRQHRSAVVHGQPSTTQGDGVKLHRYLAQVGLGSRRDMEALISSGGVRVNGQAAHVGQRVHVGDRLDVGRRRLRVLEQVSEIRVLLYHKPTGEIVTRDDPRGRRTVFAALPRLPQGKWQSVGRLDINSEGLLLFTNSGKLAHRLMHPRFGFEREYAARVMGELSDAEQQKLLDGVALRGKVCRLTDIRPGEQGEGINCWYHVCIAEGRNREVRRLFDSVGHVVSRLIRVRYGPIALPPGLRRGQVLELKGAALEQLLQLLDLKADCSRQPPPRATGVNAPRRAPDRRRQASSQRAGRAQAHPDGRRSDGRQSATGTRKRTNR